MAFRKISTPQILTKTEQDKKRTREFKGDGTAFLKVPGLLHLESLSVATGAGRMNIPLSEDRLHMVHPDEAVPRERVTEDLVMLETEDYTESTLMRSELSNGGNWQKGASFFVTGDWEEDSESEPAKVENPQETGETGNSEAAGQTADADKAEVDLAKSTDDDKADTDKADDEIDYGNLSDELKDKIAQLITRTNSIEGALNSTNLEFNDVGIKGREIQHAKSVLKRAAKASS